MITIKAEPDRVAVRLLQASAVDVQRVEQVAIQELRGGLTVLAVGGQGPEGPQGPSGSAVSEAYTAGTDLGGHRIVVTDASGHAIYADNTNATHANMATKLTLGAALQGDIVQVQLTGRVIETSWTWTVGGTIYVGANGLLTQTLPVAPAVFSKPFAVAETATRILLIQESPVILT